MGVRFRWRCFVTRPKCHLIAVTRPDLIFVPTAAEVQYGEQVFGRLRNASIVVDGY
jgi:hypothetical protein